MLLLFDFKTVPSLHTLITDVSYYLTTFKLLLLISSLCLSPYNYDETKFDRTHPYFCCRVAKVAERRYDHPLTHPISFGLLPWAWMEFLALILLLEIIFFPRNVNLMCI